MPAWALAVVVAAGCAADLLPGEEVLGDDVAAVVIEGGAGSETGAGLVFGQGTETGVLAIGAPGAGEVFAVDETGTELWRVGGPGRFGARTWWTAEGFAAWAPGVGVYRVDGEGSTLVQALADARRVDLCPDGSALWSTDEGEDVACADEGALWTSCDGSTCTVVLQDGEDTRSLGEVAPGGMVAFEGGDACWSDPRLDDDPTAGGAECADDRAVEGLRGDHVGASLGAGRAGGVFNKWILPARLRILPLDGGPVWAVDRAAERTGVELADDPVDGRVAVGVPGAIGADAEQGRVYLVSP